MLQIFKSQNSRSIILVYTIRGLPESDENVLVVLPGDAPTLELGVEKGMGWLAFLPPPGLRPPPPPGRRKLEEPGRREGVEVRKAAGLGAGAGTVMGFAAC